ncbi:MAG: 4Fe-4S binding protein [Actinomycetota bacterium]|nr:4Fe-4S binding protein [Actinomycetota bacterium]
MQQPPNSRREMIEGMIGERGQEVRVVAELCDGCRDCLSACKEAVGSNADKEAVSRISIKEEGDLRIPILCHNCEEPPCVAACMPGARVKRDGFVQTDYAKCVGCWMCIMACPFGATLRAAGEHLAYKCEGCLEEEIPACVQVCKPGALVKVGPTTYSQDRRRENSVGYFLPPEE